MLWWVGAGFLVAGSVVIGSRVVEQGGEEEKVKGKGKVE